MIVEWVIVALLAAGVVVGVYLGVSLPRKWRALRRPEVVTRVVAEELRPCAVYLYFSRRMAGLSLEELIRAVLYVGIAFDPQNRAEQHAEAADEEWTRQVVDVEAFMFPDRFSALAAEWALIRYLDPPYNKAPSGSCDAWTAPRPPITEVRVRFPGRARARVLAAARRSR